MVVSRLAVVRGLVPDASVPLVVPAADQLQLVKPTLRSCSAETEKRLSPAATFEP